MTGKCDVIIPSKNAPWWLALCLTELFRNADASELGRVLVIDDSSTADAFATIQRICARHPGVTLLQNTGRPGFGGACNFGVRNSSAPYLLFLNTDCLIVRGTLRKLAAACAADASIGLACPLSNNSPCLTLPLLPGRSYMEMDALLENAAQKLPARDVVLDACTVVGNCLLITRACWEKTGEFSEEWGLGYGEESDYQMRAIAQGFRGVALTNAYVFHFGNGSFRYEPSANTLRSKNHAQFMAKWGDKYKSLLAQQERHDPAQIAASRLAALPAATLTPQVLFLLPSLVQGVGGVHADVDICNHLLREGLDAKVAVLGHFDPEQLKDYQEPMFAGMLHFPDEAALLKQTAIAPRCVVGTYFTTMPPCFWYAALRHIHAAYFVQGYECLFANGAHYNKVIDTYPMTDRLFVTSEWLKERVASHGVATPPAVLPIGIDLDLFTPKNRTPSTPQKIRLGMVLRNADDKGQWILLDLLHELAAHSKELELTVLAASQYAMPREWNAMNCRWLVLPLERAAVANQLAACDILVDASLHEGFGLIPLEAMACGATVVVSDSGGINQYVRHGINGLIVPEINRPEKYAAAIRSLLSDKALLEKLKSNALKTAADYDASTRYSAYAAFFRELLSSPVQERDQAWRAAVKMYYEKAATLSEQCFDLLRAKDRQIQGLSIEREKIIHGLSFRIGRIVTAPLRLLFGKS